MSAATSLEYTSVELQLPKGMARTSKSKIEKKRKTIAKRKQKIQKLLERKEKLDIELKEIEEANRYDIDKIALHGSDDEVLGELSDIQKEIEQIRQRDNSGENEGGNSGN